MGKVEWITLATLFCALAYFIGIRVGFGMGQRDEKINQERLRFIAETKVYKHAGDIIAGIKSVDEAAIELTDGDTNGKA